ncbi:hypothetical protein [Actinomadura sp. NTSP31]|uniref:hypothetical protein n=1 Tax=Actinomadura sp. NTSP31 TaxID=1735447 RepID=UPI0035BF363A
MTNTVNVVVGMDVFGGLSVLPLYQQFVKGLSPTAAGLMLLPQALGIVASGRLCGSFATRTGRYKGLLLLGLAIMTACAFARSSILFSLAEERIVAALHRAQRRPRRPPDRAARPRGGWGPRSAASAGQPGRHGRRNGHRVHGGRLRHVARSGPRPSS